MFLTTDVFFYSLDIKLQWSRTDKNSVLWFSFCLHLKCHPQSEDYAPGHNHQFLKHSIFLSVLQLEKSIFLDLVLLCFTPQLLPTLSIDLLDGQLLILRQLHCHMPVSEFSTQWNSIRRKKQHWNALHEPHDQIYPHFRSSHFQN